MAKCSKGLWRMENVKFINATSDFSVSNYEIKSLRNLFLNFVTLARNVYFLNCFPIPL